MIDGATARLAGKSYTRKHCDERPREAEIYDVQRFLEAAERYDLDAHLAHLTTKESIGLAGEHARKRPGRVSAEVALHHTMFCDRDMERRGAALKMNPPLRPAADRDYVRGELLRGDMELMLVTDHAAHTRASKESPNPPSGITGSDHLGAAVSQFLATKELEPVRAAAITSFNAALRFGFSEGDDKRARIAEGFLGDLVELDPENEGISRIYTKCGHTPYALGEDAWPETRRVWLGGKLVADNGVLLLD
ncbi:MAG: hypothetical protein FJY76_04210 [Candidatus Aenigmarchaeota archaeon]|nr:hypothetical protein [Candidatus Aenigmarchaeota archaeon]